jgi:glycosyltransferase involved in cell wall biosynthesis
VISVIVPVYNAEPYLDRVIAALVSQDYPRDAFELIFIDNGSTDGSLAILARHPEIRVFSVAERGSYAARNHGVREARGDILAFTDSDCYPVKGWLRAIDEAFRRSNAQVLLGPRVPPVNSRSVRLIAEYENKKAELVCASNDPMLYFGHTNNMAVRKAAMDRFGPFVQRARGSDTIFVRRVVDELTCSAVAYCPEMSVQHAELDSIGAYYGKVKTYGGSRKAYGHIKTVKPLNQQQRLEAFRAATRRHRIVDAAHLFALLVGGSIAWWYGGLGVRPSDS